MQLSRLGWPALERVMVVVAGGIHPAGLAILKSCGDVLEVGAKEDLRLPVAAADALFVRPPARATAEVLAAGPRLRVVATAGVGLDHIDVDAASALGIAVLHLPGVGAVAVAEHTVALILALSKSLAWADRMTRAGRFEARLAGASVELMGKTASLVGFGSIGQEVARRLGPGLGMRIVVFDPRARLPPGVDRAGSLQEALAEGDVISLHLPLTPANRHLIGAAELNQMKASAWLVNTSRGGIVDEAALVEALREGRIAGAGIDVFEGEPASADNPLFQLENVIVTPHMAGLTRETGARLAATAGERICAILRGETPAGIANLRIGTGATPPAVGERS